MRNLISCLLAAVSLPLAARAIDTAALKEKCTDKLEQLAEKMIPQKELNEAMGFFGPVTKKYLPVFQTFNGEYLASTNKLAVVRKYMPQADSALKEAREMKVPAKYEQQKAKYLRMVESFLALVKLMLRFGA